MKKILKKRKLSSSVLLMHFHVLKYCEHDLKIFRKNMYISWPTCIFANVLIRQPNVLNCRLCIAKTNSQNLFNPHIDIYFDMKWH